MEILQNHLSLPPANIQYFHTSLYEVSLSMVVLCLVLVLCKLTWSTFSGFAFWYLWVDFIAVRCQFAILPLTSSCGPLSAEAGLPTFLSEKTRTYGFSGAWTPPHGVGCHQCTRAVYLSESLQDQNDTPNNNKDFFCHSKFPLMIQKQ